MDRDWRLEIDFNHPISIDEEEVFRREAELTLSESQGENREISGCLQGAPSPSTRISKRPRKFAAFPSECDKRVHKTVE